MDGISYKNLDSEKDILYAQKNEVEELFYPQQGIVKPYNSSNNIVVETTDPPTENPDEYNEITYVKNQNSDINYFSFGRAEKDNYTAGASTGMMYSYIKSLLYPTWNDFRVEDGNSSFYIVTKFDVMAITREWYRDSLDPNFFSVFINTGASTPTTSTPTFASTSNVLGLFASEKEYQSPLGEKRYLYPTSLTTELYDNSTDSLTMVEESELDKTVPYGEVIIDAGIVILYTGIIEANHTSATTTTLLHYMAGVMGRSRTQVNSTIYYCRATNSEFNYTTNRTFYRDDAENIIKQEFRESPTTFITAIGLYNDKNQCVAYGRLSQPIKKDFTKESNIIAEINL